MPILNYTTKIDCYKSIGEIQKILANHGASKIVIDNDSKTNPVALTFSITWNDQLVAFQLPCNFKGVLRAMESNKKVPRNLCNQDQALRVGWRIVKDWVEAQMAIVESQLATMPEVFLPYAITKQGSTLFNHMENNRNLFLTGSTNN